MSKPGPTRLVMVVAWLVVLVRSQSIIPWRYDGFVYRKEAASTESVLIEAFYDPVCPDSRDSWLPLKRAVDHYATNLVSLIVHTFPLPTGPDVEPDAILVTGRTGLKNQMT
ncbi:hypothetical protein R6Q59_013432 [Mikania micrantha]